MDDAMGALVPSRCQPLPNPIWDTMIWPQYPVTLTLALLCCSWLLYIWPEDNATYHCTLVPPTSISSVSFAPGHENTMLISLCQISVAQLLIVVWTTDETARVLTPGSQKPLFLLPPPTRGICHNAENCMKESAKHWSREATKPETTIHWHQVLRRHPGSQDDGNCTHGSYDGVGMAGQEQHSGQCFHFCVRPVPLLGGTANSGICWLFDVYYGNTGSHDGNRIHGHDIHRRLPMSVIAMAYERESLLELNRQNFQRTSCEDKAA